MQRNVRDTPEPLARRERSSPRGRILAEVLRQRHQPREIQRIAVEDACRAVAHELNRYIPALGTVAVIAPLMGLFGTVVGMIEIFGSYRSEEHTSELQSLMRISYAVFCLKKTT